MSDVSCIEVLATHCQNVGTSNEGLATIGQESVEIWAIRRGRGDRRLPHRLSDVRASAQTASSYLGPAGALWRQTSRDNLNAIEACPILVLEVELGTEREAPLVFFLSLEYGRQGLLWHEYGERPELEIAPVKEVRQMSSPKPLLRVRDLLRSWRGLQYDPQAGVHGSWFVERLIAGALVLP